MPIENLVDCSKGQAGVGLKTVRVVQQSDLPPPEVFKAPTDADKLSLLATQAGFASVDELRAALAA